MLLPLLLLLLLLLAVLLILLLLLMLRLLLDDVLLGFDWWLFVEFARRESDCVRRSGMPIV